MLLAFVLLGKAVEERAKIQASSDMTSLLSILPTKANLVVDESKDGPPATVEVACESLAVGDRVLVFPGVRNFVLGMIFPVSSAHIVLIKVDSRLVSAVVNTLLKMQLLL